GQAQDHVLGQPDRRLVRRRVGIVFQIERQNLLLALDDRLPARIAQRRDQIPARGAHARAFEALGERERDDRHHDREQDDDRDQCDEGEAARARPGFGNGESGMGKAGSRTALLHRFPIPESRFPAPHCQLPKSALTPSPPAWPSLPRNTMSKLPCSPGARYWKSWPNGSLRSDSFAYGPIQLEAPPPPETSAESSDGGEPLSSE